MQYVKKGAEGMPQKLEGPDGMNGKPQAGSKGGAVKKPTDTGSGRYHAVKTDKRVLTDRAKEQPTKGKPGKDPAAKPADRTGDKDPKQTGPLPAGKPERYAGRGAGKTFKWPTTAKDALAYLCEEQEEKSKNAKGMAVNE